MKKDFLNNSNLRLVVNSLFFDINEQNIIARNDVSEYDIQNRFLFYLKLIAKNTGYGVKRETRKIDVLISKKRKSRTVSEYAFEIKTYIKKHESLSLAVILKDVNKLRKHLLVKRIKNKRAFLLIGISQKKLNNIKGKGKLIAHFLRKEVQAKQIAKCFGTSISIIRSFQICSSLRKDKASINSQIRFFLIEIQGNKIKK